jgi:hypothetical protein
MVLLLIFLPFLPFIKSCLVTSLIPNGLIPTIPTTQKRLQLVQLRVPHWALPLAIAGAALVVAETIVGIDLTTSSPRRYQSK